MLSTPDANGTVTSSPPTQFVYGSGNSGLVQARSPTVCSRECHWKVDVLCVPHVLHDLFKECTVNCTQDFETNKANRLSTARAMCKSMLVDYDFEDANAVENRELFFNYTRDVAGAGAHGSRSSSSVLADRYGSDALGLLNAHCTPDQTFAELNVHDSYMDDEAAGGAEMQYVAVQKTSFGSAEDIFQTFTTDTKGVGCALIDITSQSAAASYYNLWAYSLVGYVAEESHRRWKHKVGVEIVTTAAVAPTAVKVECNPLESNGCGENPSCRWGQENVTNAFGALYGGSPAEMQGCFKANTGNMSAQPAAGAQHRDAAAAHPYTGQSDGTNRLFTLTDYLYAHNCSFNTTTTTTTTADPCLNATLTGSTAWYLPPFSEHNCTQPLWLADAAAQANATTTTTTTERILLYGEEQSAVERAKARQSEKEADGQTESSGDTRQRLHIIYIFIVIPKNKCKSIYLHAFPRRNVIFSTASIGTKTLLFAMI